MTKIHELHRHHKMNVNEALEVARRIKLKKVLVIGYDLAGDLFATSSEMDYASTVFMCEQLKQKVISDANKEND